MWLCQKTVNMLSRNQLVLDITGTSLKYNQHGSCHSPATFCLLGARTGSLRWLQPYLIFPWASRQWGCGGWKVPSGTAATGSAGHACPLAPAATPPSDRNPRSCSLRPVAHGAQPRGLTRAGGATAQALGPAWTPWGRCLAKTPAGTGAAAEGSGRACGLPGQTQAPPAPPSRLGPRPPRRLLPAWGEAPRSAARRAGRVCVSRGHPYSVQ